MRFTKQIPLSHSHERNILSAPILWLDVRQVLNVSLAISILKVCYTNGAIEFSVNMCELLLSARYFCYCRLMREGNVFMLCVCVCVCVRGRLL